MSKSQSTLAFPARKSNAAARKPAASKQQQRSASAKKSQQQPASSTAVVNKQLVSTPRRAEEDDEVRLTRTRSSPRSEPIHRTNSHERTKHGQCQHTHGLPLLCTRGHRHRWTLAHPLHTLLTLTLVLLSTWPLLLLSARDSLLSGTWTDASDNEVLLRKFDLDYSYGPCGGLSRKARWQRAQHMQLNPPQHIWDILQQIEDDDDEQPWDAERREGGGGGAEVDEADRRKKRKKYDIDSHSLFENVTARILEAEGRGPP